MNHRYNMRVGRQVKINNAWVSSIQLLYWQHMDNNTANNEVNTLYPDLEQKYSSEERDFLAKIANSPVTSGFQAQLSQGQGFQNQGFQNESQAYQQPQNQGFNAAQNQGWQPQPPQIEKQDIKEKTFKSHQKWQDLVKDVVHWVKKNIHPCRIVGFSVVLCHSTTFGQCTIFYDNSKSHQLENKIRQYLNYTLAAALVQTSKSWDGHHKEVLKNMSQMTEVGNVVIGSSELETNMVHNTATSVIWFLRPSA